MELLEVFANYFATSGFGQFHWTNGVMIAVGLLFIYLAVRRGFEPLLLVPIGFGILIGNIPYNAQQLPLSVYDGPVSPHDLTYYGFDPAHTRLHFEDEDEPRRLADYIDQWRADRLAEARADRAVRLQRAADLEPAEARSLAEEQIDIEDVPWHHGAFMNVMQRCIRITFDEGHEPEQILEPSAAHVRVHAGKAIMVNTHSILSARRVPEAAPQIIRYGQGRYLFVEDLAIDQRYPEIWSIRKQNPFTASIFWWLYAGVGVAGFYPPLIFLGIGALTDFGPMLSRPKTLLLGAAAQFGIFGSLLGALFLEFSLKEAASIGIIGGADGPTAIFVCSQLAPDLLGAVALAAYSYMALVPIIQPPIIKLLTTPEERRIHMETTKPVSKTVKILFPIVSFLLTAFIAPGGLPLLGMLFFGNLLRESLVTDRLAKTAQTSFIDIVTILLGITVGAKTSAPNFLTVQTIYIFLLGIAAFAVATACGVLFGKLMNAMSKEQINPMIGAAGVSAVPMAARVVHKVGQEEDPQNFLLMHAMGPNVAGVIGSAVAAGVLLSKLAGT